MNRQGAVWAADVVRQGNAERPWLVWLHGLLGSADDWAPVLPFFRDWPQAALDLPGHGRSAMIAAEGFADVSHGLAHTLAALNIRRYILIGYSLGGRIALYHACRDAQAGLCGVFVEGAHPGLAGEAEREARCRHDREWARRFGRQPMASVLADWYRQPVFSDLSEPERRGLCALRAANNGVAVAGMLEATSLACQPDLLASLRALPVPFGYLCGERDHKFAGLARQEGLPFSLVPGAGHNAHRANPPAFAGQLLSLLAPLY